VSSNYETAFDSDQKINFEMEDYPDSKFKDFK